MQAQAHRDVRIHVAATAATEHLTAIFADWMLRRTAVLQGAEPRLQTLWMWHAAEESEHRSTAFDLYRALGGSEKWRITLFHYITITFLIDVARQTVRNLWHDGSLLRWSTWRSGWQLLMSRDGMYRGNYQAWRAYKAATFHPRQQDGSMSEQWLRDHADQYTPVGQAA
jgi:predicted metal-dependent hydrolase